MNGELHVMRPMYVSHNPGAHFIAFMCFFICTFFTFAVLALLSAQLGEDGATEALRLGGTLPAAVRWLSRQRGPSTSDPAWVAQRFRSWFRPLLERWWRVLTTLERDALHRLALGQQDGLGSATVNGLVERGLLIAVDDVPQLNGEVLTEYAARWSEPVS